MFEFSWSAKRTIESLEKAGVSLDSLTNDVRLLLYGAKPAVYISMSWGFIKHFMGNYPCITVPHVGKGLVFIFQNSELMYQYMIDKAKLMQHNRLGVSVVECSEEDLGLLLGFPPSASKWFGSSDVTTIMKTNKNKYHEIARFIDYHGYIFASHVTDVVNSVDWMLENRPIPEVIQTGISVKQILECNEKGRVVRKDVKSFEEFKAMNGFVEHN